MARSDGAVPFTISTDSRCGARETIAPQDWHFSYLSNLAGSDDVPLTLRCLVMQDQMLMQLLQVAMLQRKPALGSHASLQRHGRAAGL